MKWQKASYSGMLMVVSNKEFCTKILGDINCEGMVIIVCYNDQNIAEINYEKGIDQIEIEILSSGDESSDTIFPLQDFLEVLEKAKEIAIRCAKEDEMRKKGIDF